jgi:RimJ/RimL family protein N-acetyltransferase
MSYSCLNTQSLSKNEYQIVPLRYQDIFNIKQWRNDQIDYMRQTEPLTDEMQTQYYQNVIAPSFKLKHPNQILFSYLFQNICIGYGGIVHINWPSKRGEVSFLLETQRTKDLNNYQKEFSTFLELIKKMAFEDLHFHRLYTETFDIRPHHVAVLEKEGFAFEGCMKDHIFLNGHYIDSLLHGCINESMEK